ncbi:efflux RND transporter periplasmic adaptor subunit [Paenibacillus antri]|uniref:Efflux RND transporter periplasmic adaptor subunit n=1 Tax=Paenibacillus antri TaxID=2582848 RepID=A0A5R9GCS3_9BACL|nr:efflux RND transporter periplasmic adaptor subunit [Paenibacillus antri]TLS51178.1 efflux RND transporter periplasmic adaptor subunit [Paenibacillus antri]
MRKKWLWLLALVLVVGGLATVNVMRLGSSLTVELATAETGVVAESVFANGRFYPASERTVYADRAGRVAEVHAKPGDAVKAGDPLMTYDAEEWRRQLESERNQLAIAALTREQERKRSFEAVRGQTDAAEAEKTLAAEESAERLYALQTASTEASIEALERNIERSVVLAEADGVVASASVQPGAYVSPGAEAFRLADVSQLLVKAALNELDAGKVRTGMKAIVSGDAFETTFEGELTYVSPVARPAGVDGLDYEVEIEVSLPRGEVPPEVAKPGFAATLEFALAGEERVLVPIDAVRYSGQDAYVFGVTDGAAVRLPVTVGKDDGERIEVLSGLSAGDAYVYPVPEGLTEGDAVKTGADE